MMLSSMLRVIRCGNDLDIPYFTLSYCLMHRRKESELLVAIDAIGTGQVMNV